MPLEIRLSRRQALALSLAGAATMLRKGPLRADEPVAEVPWLAEVQTPSAAKLAAVAELQPLLVSEAGEPVKSLHEWRRRRRELREAWLKFLGPMPAERPVVKLTVLSEERPEGCVRQLVRYEGEPGIPVEGYLLRPTAADRLKGNNGKLPAVVGLHQTTNASIDEIAGVSGPEPMQIGLKLCRRGFVVFCPRCFLWQGTSDLKKATDDFLARRPGTLGMHKMLYDAMRGVDVVAAQPDVDPERIGTAGHSLGAKEALYLAAFDERIQAAVASEGGVGFPFTNWNAPWYLGEKIREAGFPLNHHQLIALTAPRALLILAGEKGPGAADGDRTWPYLEAALPVYHLSRKPARLGLYNHRQGHAIPEKAFERMAEWLETYTRSSK